LFVQRQPAFSIAPDGVIRCIGTAGGRRSSQRLIRGTM
jgi:hypothetical protein